MSDMQVRARTPFSILSTNLADLLHLPDAEAAERLNERLGVLDQIQRFHERSYVERGIICREFERRKLWQYLTDPETGQSFPHFTAWMSCSDFLGCRRTNFEAKADIKELEKDIDAAALIDVKKDNIKVLKQLSSHVRKQPAIVAAAKQLPPREFEAKVEREQPLQHIEIRKPLRFSPPRSAAKVIEEWIEYAIEHELAGSRDEAIVRACEMALHDAQLDAELAAMPSEEAPCV